MKFYELKITIRAGSVDTIRGLLPRAVSDFMLGDNLATFSSDESNYSVILIDGEERVKTSQG